MDDWNLIEEKEPPKDKLTLFCGIRGAVFLGYYVGDAHHFLGYSRGARPLGERGKTRTVTAWLPVPNPYIDKKKLEEFERIRKEYIFHKNMKNRTTLSGEIIPWRKDE